MHLLSQHMHSPEGIPTTVVLQGIHCKGVVSHGSDSHVCVYMAHKYINHFADQLGGREGGREKETL